MPSYKYSLNKDDLLTVGKISLFTGIVAALTTLSTLVPQINFGVLQPVVALIVVGIGVLIKQFMAGAEEPKVASPVESAPQVESNLQGLSDTPQEPVVTTPDAV